MQLPALKNAVPISLGDGQSIEDFIRNSTQNLQRMAAAMPGSGTAGTEYLNFNGNTGEYKLHKEVIDAKSVGRILVPQHGLFEGYVEWANSSVLQRIKRQLLGVHYDEPMSERMLPKPLSPNAYKKETDGPAYVLGFVGFLLDDGSTVMFEHSSMGATKAVNALATACHPGARRLRRDRPPGDRARLHFIRKFVSGGSRPEVHRDRLRHRQTGAGGQRHL
jgi:hypothetical protein